MEENPLIVLYGVDAINLALKEIDSMGKNSNIPFDRPFIELGISFLMQNASAIVKKEKKECSLKSLVSESFGFAAMYKYNVNGGVL